MADETTHPASGLHLELTVPCDERFSELLNAVSRKMAAYVGYAGADADAVAATVMQATGGLLTRNPPGGYTSLDLTFAARGDEMEILLRYRRRRRSGQSAPSDIRERLCGCGEGGAPVDAMRRVMAGVECGCEDGVEFCRLTKRLPDGPA